MLSMRVQRAQTKADAAGPAAVTEESLDAPAGLRAALDVVAVEGWSGATGAAVLTYAPRRVVRRLVSQRGFTGHAVDEATTTGLAVAWEVLNTRGVREASRPWGVVWRAVDRALSADLPAARHQSGPARAWRVAAVVEGGEGMLFVEDTPRLEHVVGDTAGPERTRGLAP